MIILDRPMTDREMNKHFGHLEDHQYRHFNRSLGCWVESKEHFKRLLFERGMTPFEVANDTAKNANKHKPYVVSKETRQFIESLKLTADRKGNIHLGDRAIKKMIDLGCDFTRGIPRDYKVDEGGFDNAV